MIARNFISIVFVTLLISCSGRKETTIPAEILGKEKMTAILTDIHLVEGAKLGRRIMGDTVLADVYYQKVFEKYEVSQEKFEESFNFYSDHPDIMDKLYDQVIENLNSVEVVSPRWEDKKENQQETDSTAIETDSSAVKQDTTVRKIPKSPFNRKIR